MFKRGNKFRKVVSEEHPIVQKKIKKSLKDSITEGSLASGMLNLGPAYFSPFALALNATTSQIGILNAISGLLPSLVQLKTSRMLEKFTRKKITLTSAFLRALMLIPMIFIGYLFLSGFNYSVELMLLLVALFFGLGAVSYPAWFSWMGSLVPERQRGKYFSRRNRITGFFGVMAMIVGALLLDKFAAAGMVFVGFGILFSVAFILRLISLIIMKKQYEPKLKIHKKAYFSFKSFLKKGRNTPFGRFTLFTSLFRITTNIASPFFVVYLLRDLGFSYTWFMIITVSGILAHLIFYPVLGKVSDRFGNISLLKISIIAIGVTPLLLLVSRNPYYLTTIPQIVSGFGWAGFTLATNNYIYDSVSQEKRAYGLTYFNLLNGIALFIGAGIGSAIALMNITFMNTILFIYIISGAARLGMYFVGMKMLKEVRHVQEFSPQFIMKEFQPVQGLSKEIHLMKHGIEKVEHYVELK
jgi:MFS family permease